MCDICKRSPCNERCPNTDIPRPLIICKICGHMINFYEEYIENDLGKQAHLSCFDESYELLDFLNIKTKMMIGEKK